jgi:four helix bundle protein
MKITRFEDIESWQLSRALTQSVYAVTRGTQFACDFGLRDQIQRAAVSSMLNIAEGFDSGSNAEFIKFLRYAQRSCTEVQSALYVALDQDYVADAEFQVLYSKAQSARSKIGAFIKYLLSHEAKTKNPSSLQPRTTN